MKVEVDGPTGKFFLTNLHLITARKSLVKLNSVETILEGNGPSQVEEAIYLRGIESERTRAFISDGRSNPSGIAYWRFQHAHIK